MFDVHAVKVTFKHKTTGLILNKTFYFDDAEVARKFGQDAELIKDVHSVSDFTQTVYQGTLYALKSLNFEINRED